MPRCAGSSSSAFRCPRAGAIVRWLLAASAPIAAAQMKRGLPGKEDSHVHPVAPLTLTQSVIGDSARFYAAKYERYERRRSEFKLAGAFVIALGLVAAIPVPCHKPTCTVRPPASVNKPLVIAGSTLALTSLVFRFLAAKAMTRALWWHDASLRR
jgi:hypothetical protein